LDFYERALPLYQALDDHGGEANTPDSNVFYVSRIGNTTRLAIMAAIALS